MQKDGEKIIFYFEDGEVMLKQKKSIYKLNGEVYGFDWDGGFFF